MRLESLRVAGFKTFVDPVSISFRGNLTGIVGPNGCGKSNLFEAMSWVMGETSARQLRGESMSDVIFAGTRDRQAGSLASVELIFDNTSGRVGGRFGSYEKIAVKRSMDREGISSYFLNGTRCRRRDIMAMFMGTGLGARRYSIIEQGMIARLIEAKPDVLGTHLEEAAQISGYRHSRKETEARMRATRENLSHLRLMMDEVDKQVRVVRQQAAAAKRYRRLRENEKRLQVELTALSWQQQQQEWSENESEISELLVERERMRAEQSATVAARERVHRDLSSLEKQAAELQERIYRNTSVISRLEQDLQYRRDRLQELTGEIGRTEQRMARQKEQQGQARRELDEARAEEESQRSRVSECEQEEKTATGVLAEAERRAGEDRERNERERTLGAEAGQRLLVLDERKDSLQLQLEKLVERQRRLEEELRDLSRTDEEGLDVRRQRLAEQTDRINGLIQREQQGREQLNDLRRQGERLRRQAAERHQRHGLIDSRLASLREAQKVALRMDRESANDWLEQTGLATQARLADRLRVSPRWRTAVETVLNIRLRDLEMADMDSLLQFNSDKPSDCDVGAYATGIQAGRDEEPTPNGLPLLRDLVSAPALPASYLAGVCVADDLSLALAARPLLRDRQSVVTADGVWLGRDWLRIGRPMQAGVLDRAAEIQDVIRELDEARRACAAGDGQVRENARRCEQKEEELHVLREELRSGQETLSERHGALVAAETRDEHRRQSSAGIREDLGTLVAEQGRLRQEYDDVMRERDDADQRVDESRQRAEKADATWRSSHKALEEARRRREQAREERHQAALNRKATVTRCESLEQILNDRQSSLKQTEDRHRLLCAEREKAQAELPAREDDLRHGLEEKDSLERQRQEKGRLTENEKEKLSEWEEAMQKGMASERELEGRLQEKQLRGKEVRTRMDMLAERLDGARVEDVLRDVGDESDPASWRDKLEAVQGRLQKFGGVNLAAIDELGKLNERKDYLDKQNDDLEEALKTLTRSIRRIDAESRSRFQETFARVNENFHHVFSHLFGGGEANLILSGADDQAPEVQVRAQPPGKRRGSIHVLSGGEKALTAIALVFAIFKLNPAPLCLLDEVDAPLDDYNVRRYMDWVINMATEVQFVFITHNKITMEMADVLLGVTMGEAGVSRLVGVDMKQAVRLTDGTRDQVITA